MARPVLEDTAMTNKHDIDTTRIHAEPMIDARQAAASLRLPYYWFSDAAMRAKHKIPHYQLGALVRYRLSELCVWAARHGGIHD